MSYKRNRLQASAAIGALFVCLATAPVCSAQGQSDKPLTFQQAVGNTYTHTRWFPNLAGPYVPPHVPPFQVANTAFLYELIQNGVMHLSLDDALALAIENNLNIAVDRYNPKNAYIDRVRAASGQATRGINGMFGSSALFSQALGGGISSAPTSFSSNGAGSASGAISVRQSSAVGSFDPVVGVAAGWGYGELPLPNAVLNGVSLLTGNTGYYDVFFGQEFPTGTSYSITAGGERYSTNTTDSLFNPEVVTGLSIGIEQNILNGFGYRANAKFIRIADTEIRVSKYYFNEQLQSVIGTVLNDYWALAQDKAQVAVAQEAVDYNQELLKENQEQVRIGTLAPLDVIQSESSLATAQQNLIVAQTTYRQEEEVIKDDIAKQVTGPLVTVTINPTTKFPPPIAGSIPTVEAALDIAHKNRPEIDINRLNMRYEGYVLKANRNALLPTLDAFATYSPSGLSGQQVVFGQPTTLSQLESPPIIGHLPGGASQALSQMFRNTYPDYSVGVTLEMPILNRAAQADAARALLEEHMLQTENQQEVNAIDQAVREAEIALTQGQARIDAAQKAVMYAREQYVDEQKKFKVGESTVALVIQMQNSLTQAEGNLVTAESGYAQAITQFEQATGTVLTANHIELTDAVSGHLNRMPNIPGTPITQK
jgi:outer membrane protein